MSGGSTNGVLHLLAVAKEMGVPLDIDDFDRISARTPLLCDLKPGGQYVAPDLYEAGGVPLVLKRLKEAGLLHDERADRHRPDGGELADSADETEGQKVVRPLDDPIKPTGGLAILRGNLAPEGCVVKLAGHERRLQQRARRAYSRARRTRWPPSPRGEINAGDVVVIRNEGPAGGPGMREMLGRHRRARRRRVSARTWR